MIFLALVTGLQACGANTQEWRVLYENQYSSGAHLDSSYEWFITGENVSSAPSEMWLRADDAQSKDYASRVNHRLAVASGPFRLRVPVLALRTSNQRTLDPRSLRQVMLFQKRDASSIRIDAVTVLAAVPLPKGTTALDFGGPDSGVFPGFALAKPGDPRITGRHIRAIQRPGSDALIDDGLAGVDEIHLRVAPGRWQLSIWVDDLGEWDYVPHDLSRRIEVNGTTIFQLRRTAEQWFEEIYTAGSSREAELDGDPWQLFRAHRSVAHTAQFDVGADGLVRVRLSGDTPAATYLSALLLEPAVPGDVIKQVETDRRVRFQDHWTVANAPRSPTNATQLWALVPGAPFGMDRPPRETLASPHSLVVARGTVATFDAAVVGHPGRDTIQAKFALSDVRNSVGVSLPAVARAGQWRYRRDGNLLTPVADELHPIRDRIRVDRAIPRRIHIQIDVPPDAQEGTYEAELHVQTSETQPPAALQFRVHVLAVTLPTISEPVGVYLQTPPHQAWFPAFAAQRDATVACDLAVLSHLGITGVAPPLTTPTPGREMDFLRDYTRVRVSGFAQPVLAYTPVKKLLEISRIETLTQLGRVTKGLREAAMPQPLWSIADEPSNPDHAATDLENLVKTLRSAAPGIRLAGHLNSPRDQAWVPLFDTVLINTGFGVDERDVAKVRASGVTPWLYNMPQLRLAAGFYLWRSGAGGYLQWHARMPTAAPYDPTDGREDDFQMLYPSLGQCDSVPIVSARLFDLADGILDLRWLRWLELRAVASRDAADLLAALRADVPTTWNGATRLGAGTPAQWRARITDYARRGAAPPT